MSRCPRTPRGTCCPGPPQPRSSARRRTPSRRTSAPRSWNATRGWTSPSGSWRASRPRPHASPAPPRAGRCVRTWPAGWPATRWTPPPETSARPGAPFPVIVPARDAAGAAGWCVSSCSRTSPRRTVGKRRGPRAGPAAAVPGGRDDQRARRPGRRNHRHLGPEPDRLPDPAHPTVPFHITDGSGLRSLEHDLLPPRSRTYWISRNDGIELPAPTFTPPATWWRRLLGR
ncbi:exported hypothetical protein [Actinacidiphila bryophytorum]|uniref:Uncharacterized protein n=1 Tax=Actinacidiphila bryophytorum TaxID=1436133 RepID=A0A9W4E328_9ACTN|nr:exported hypothetical protein [Actinacidiphila bryophytorum]